MKSAVKFKETNPINNQKPKDEPQDGMKSPFDFRCPQYDQRSSNFVNAGTHYGIGMAQPIGHEGDPKMFVDTLPQGRHSTMMDDDRG